MYEIVKRVEFSFAHRLVNYDGKCNRPHGHNGVAEVTLRSETLNELGMVEDFGAVGDVVGGWIDENLDHRMILRRDDPFVAAIEELGQHAFLTDAEPTAENIAKTIFEQVVDMGLPVVAITFWETPDSSATYTVEEPRSGRGNGVSERSAASTRSPR